MQAIPDYPIDCAGEGQSADVGNIHAHAGHDKLPAGGDNIVARVLLRIAQLHEGRDDNVIVFVLREAQSEFGQLGASLKDGKGRIFADAQIDFGIDYAPL